MARESNRNYYNQEKRSEFDHKMIDLRRVARVVAGGRRFSFRACVVVGDRKGRVGVGVGKGTDTALALDKAQRDAKKKMITVPLNEAGSIPYEVEAKYGAAHVRIRSTSKGRGLVAGGAVRATLELAGVGSASAKILSHTKNKINNARAAIEALRKLREVRSQTSLKV